MGQIGARFSRQADISWGYAAYYYKTNTPVPENLSQPGASFFYLTKDKPRSIPHPDLRESALHYKGAYKMDPGGIEIYTMPDGLTQVLVPLRSAEDI